MKINISNSLHLLEVPWHQIRIYIMLIIIIIYLQLGYGILFIETLGTSHVGTYRSIPVFPGEGRFRSN